VAKRPETGREKEIYLCYDLYWKRALVTGASVVSALEIRRSLIARARTWPVGTRNEPLGALEGGIRAPITPLCAAL